MRKGWSGQEGLYHEGIVRRSLVNATEGLRSAEQPSEDFSGSRSRCSMENSGSGGREAGDARTTVGAAPSVGGKATGGLGVGSGRVGGEGWAHSRFILETDL